MSTRRMLLCTMSILLCLGLLLISWKYVGKEYRGLSLIVVILIVRVNVAIFTPRKGNNSLWNYKFCGRSGRGAIPIKNLFSNYFHRSMPFPQLGKTHTDRHCAPPSKEIDSKRQRISRNKSIHSRYVFFFIAHIIDNTTV